MPSIGQMWLRVAPTSQSIPKEAGMAAAEVHITIEQAQAIVDGWGRRKVNPVTVRQEAGEKDILVWLPNYSGTKQDLRRIKPDGRNHKGVLTRDMKAAVKQSQRNR